MEKIKNGGHLLRHTKLTMLKSVEFCQKLHKDPDIRQPFDCALITRSRPFRRRERAILRFRRSKALQVFAAVHASVSSRFNQERNLSSRRIVKLNRIAALAEWRGFCAA